VELRLPSFLISAVVGSPKKPQASTALPYGKDQTSRYALDRSLGADGEVIVDIFGKTMSCLFQESISRSLTFQLVKMNQIHNSDGDRGSTEVKVLYYKSEGRWFDPSWCGYFIDIKSFRSHYGPGVD
jgi:hypothetical protein